ncbi:hypothetical protein SISSUDRAFT_1039404 [Sistotremastrum suecicum HHB10207 ss-3]|uniref:MIP18 family-like domain-containing protein n=1 Tax=Sistotremastrum suecicum HHB10207 ss-3 TaxID=1314776 RepID=A0A166IW09_9AGAM|nr:hypothetical protein SISSUDRAFT_1039404 [Sistotremastrum suecicum HHB10207 ss-3]
MAPALINANPTIFAPTKQSLRRNDLNARALWIDQRDESDEDSEAEEDIDQQEVFDLIRGISDPEHPLSLEQLHVVSAEQIELSRNRVLVEFTPTVPHCGMSTIIGLSIRVRLMRCLPERFKLDMRVKKGSHQSEDAVNKQLNDKERVAAALENPALVDVVEQCLSTASKRDDLNPLDL